MRVLLQGVSHRHISDHLSELVETTLSDLEGSKVYAPSVTVWIAANLVRLCLLLPDILRGLEEPMTCCAYPCPGRWYRASLKTVCSSTAFHVTSPMSLV